MVLGTLFCGIVMQEHVDLQCKRLCSPRQRNSCNALACYAAATRLLQSLLVTVLAVNNYSETLFVSKDTAILNQSLRSLLTQVLIEAAVHNFCAAA